jgi:hypothetical protein
MLAKHSIGSWGPQIQCCWPTGLGPRTLSTTAQGAVAYRTCNMQLLYGMHSCFTLQRLCLPLNAMVDLKLMNHFKSFIIIIIIIIMMNDDHLFI